MSQTTNDLPLSARTRAVIDGLPPEDRKRVETLIADAAARQRQLLETALDDAVRLVPGPLRKRVQKLFLG